MALNLELGTLNRRAEPMYPQNSKTLNPKLGTGV